MKLNLLFIICLFTVITNCKNTSDTKEKVSDFSEKGEDFFNSSTIKEEDKDSKPLTPNQKNRESANGTNNESTIEKTLEPIIYDYDNEPLYLAAAKLCWNTDYENVFGYERVKVSFGGTEFKNGDEKIEVKSSCLAFVPAPYVSPMEYYYHLFHGYNTIQENISNVFKLRELRKELHEKEFENFKKKVFEIDTENVVSYTMTLATIQNYDFENNRLYINYSTQRNASVKRKKTFATIQPLKEKRQISYAHYIPMKPEVAEAIYKFYPKYNSLYENPPFPLITKTTYALNHPEKQQRPYLFDIKIKKIEFFKKQGDEFIAENKIGEVTFQ